VRRLSSYPSVRRRGSDGQRLRLDKSPLPACRMAADQGFVIGPVGDGVAAGRASVGKGAETLGPVVKALAARKTW